MPVTYTCPNCEATLKTANRLPPGKSVKCPKCGGTFVAEGGAKPDDGPLKLADEPLPPRPKVAVPPKPAAAKPAPPPPPPAKKKPDDDDDDDNTAYGVTQETDAEREASEKNKVKYGELKFKKSARGPAMALLVAPTNLLVAAGFLTTVAGLVIFVWGMWPLVFNDAPPGDEETEEAIVNMMLGLFAFGWGAIVCFGASQMQSLESYNWAMIGAVMGVIPLLVGIYCLAMLRNPKVLAGFKETAGEDVEEEPDDDEEDEDDDEEDEDDED